MDLLSIFRLRLLKLTCSFSVLGGAHRTASKSSTHIISQAILHLHLPSVLPLSTVLLLCVVECLLLLLPLIVLLRTTSYRNGWSIWWRVGRRVRLPSWRANPSTLCSPGGKQPHLHQQQWLHQQWAQPIVVATT